MQTGRAAQATASSSRSRMPRAATTIELCLQGLRRGRWPYSSHVEKSKNRKAIVDRTLRRPGSRRKTRLQVGMPTVYSVNPRDTAHTGSLTHLGGESRRSIHQARTTELGRQGSGIEVEGGSLTSSPVVGAGKWIEDPRGEQRPRFVLRRDVRPEPGAHPERPPQVC